MVAVTQQTMSIRLDCITAQVHKLLMCLMCSSTIFHGDCHPIKDVPCLSPSPGLQFVFGGKRWNRQPGAGKRDSSLPRPFHQLARPAGKVDRTGHEQSTGWFPAVCMTYMSKNFTLFHVSNLSARNFRICLLMCPGLMCRLWRCSDTTAAVLTSLAAAAAVLTPPPPPLF